MKGGRERYMSVVSVSLRRYLGQTTKEKEREGGRGERGEETLVIFLQRKKS